MILNVIHKADRTDRRAHMEAEMVRQGIDLVVWHDAITNCGRPHISIGESHKEVIRHAQRKGLEMICVAEDDLYFPADDGWKYFLSKIPQRFSLFVGGAYSYKITHDTYGFHSTVLHKWSGFHLYVVHQSFYGDFLAADTEKYNIEQALKLQLQASGKQASICWPFAAVQAETPSDNIKGKIHKINDYFNKYNTYGFQ
jgi:hypothetical protein